MNGSAYNDKTEKPSWTKIYKRSTTMPVFDFSNTPDDNNEDFVCTYTTFRSNERTATAEKPILVLDNSKRKWKHHS